MLNRHQRQFHIGGLGDQRAPNTGAQYDVIGHDGALGRLHAHSAPVFNNNFIGGRVGKHLQLARCNGFVHQIASHFLRARCHQARIRVPHSAFNAVFFEQRKALFRFGRSDHVGVGAKGLTRTDFTQ